MVSESARLESALDEAGRLCGTQRVEAVTAALRVLDKGEYFPRSRAPWFDERRRALADLVARARFDAADAAISTGRYERARALNGAVLEVEPLREAAWRQQMRIAATLGDGDAVLVAFRRCRNALAEVGAEPTPTTRRLLETLRR